MSASNRQARLVALLEERIAELDKSLAEPLSADTPLISSGLLDSLAVLSLAEWVDEELRQQLDLTAADIPNEWDTIANILAFIDART